MKVIGIIGGVTWVSTQDYTRRINQMVAERLGGLHSARLAVWSLDFAPMAEAQHSGDWDRVAGLLIEGARALKRAGADLGLIAANTLHLVYDRVTRETDLPFLNIVDSVGQTARARGFGRVGLLGTKFTMEHPFYRERLEQGFDLEVLVPERPARDEVHRVIYEELGRDIVKESSRREVSGMARDLAARGAEAVILGCTELPHLFPEATDLPAGEPGAGARPAPALPLLDPLVLHCRAAVELALRPSDT